MSHTPGKWNAICDPPKTKLSRMALVTTPSDGRAIDATGSGNNYAEDCANARLISAAPELLEVVKAFVEQEVDYMTRNKLGDPEQQHNVKWARAVIAKAEGK